MHPRRPLLKRVALWTAAVVLLLGGYVAGMPIAAYAVGKYADWAEPVGVIVYAPLIYALKNDLPGSEPYEAYCEWCIEWLSVND